LFHGGANWLPGSDKNRDIAKNAIIYRISITIPRNYRNYTT